MDPTTSQARNDTTQSSGISTINQGVPNQIPAFQNAEAKRQKIVKILANTANGCLKELGYYPGMSVKMQEMQLLCKEQEQDIERMKLEQRRLFEDNVKLNSLSRTQASRLKYMGLTEIEKATRMAQLEEEVQRLRIQKKELVQGRSIQDAGGAEVQLSFTELQIKHMDLLESYRLAYAEVQRLCDQVKTQSEEMASLKMQLNTVVVQQQGASNGSNQAIQMASQPPSQSTSHLGQGSSPTYRPMVSSFNMQRHPMQPQQFMHQGAVYQQSTHYMPQAGSSVSPIVISPEPQNRPLPQYPSNVGQRHPPNQLSVPQQQMRPMQQQQQQQQFNVAPDSRSHYRPVPDNMNSNYRISQQPYPSATVYEGPVASSSSQSHYAIRDPVMQHHQQRRASFPIPNQQPTSIGQHQSQVIQQPNLTTMGPPMQPPQYNPGPTHRTNASLEVPPWSAPPSVSRYEPPGFSNQVPLQARPQVSMPIRSDLLLAVGNSSRQTRSVPTTPTQMNSEPSQSLLGIRTPNSVSRPSSAVSSPRVYLPPPPQDESTIINVAPRLSNSNMVGGASLARPTSASSWPDSRQSSAALPSPRVTQLRPMIPAPLPSPTPNLDSEVSVVRERPILGSPVKVTTPQPRSSAAPTPLGTPTPMKRESSTSVAELRQMSEEQPKRMRVDVESSSSPRTQTPSASQPLSVAPSGAAAAAAAAASPAEVVVKGEPMDDVLMSSTPFPNNNNGGDVQMDEEEEVEEVIIVEEELGPDGLRLASNCFPDVYDMTTDEDGNVTSICKLCQYRYTMKVVKDPPKPFVNASDDELEKHCLDDHESVWENIRQP